MSSSSRFAGLALAVAVPAAVLLAATPAAADPHVQYPKSAVQSTGGAGAVRTLGGGGQEQYLYTTPVTGQP